MCFPARKWLSDLPRGPVRPIGREVEYVHGSPADEDEYIFFREDACAALHANRAWITFCGHMHWQVGWSLNGDELTPLKPDFESKAEIDQFDLLLRRSNRYFLNPGSIGEPREGDWRAAFAIFDDAQSLLSWYRVPY